MRPSAIQSITDVCEVSFHPEGSHEGRRVDLLIELPHGATRLRDFDSIRSRLHGPLPERLEDFFFVNTDVGSFECARWIAERVGSRTMIVRSIIPRTLIDCNRIVDSSEAGMTPGLASYITVDRDRDWLTGLHDAYLEVAAAAYREVCDPGGLALTLHTYAPRSVGIDTIDADIVERLHRAYQPGVFETWPLRPDVDIICEDVDSRFLASRDLVQDLKRRYAAAGHEAKENGTYRLHPATLGYRFATRYPEQVLCVELNRALLADPFSPFEEMRISDEAVGRMSAPIASALQQALTRTARP